MILTPDQRLRVFVSSTLQDLIPEREAASRAVRELRLIPVTFEAGARPHPPRDLYRAYLNQSHIFIGIYWERYGWIAEGMEVSGLEDEYLLSGDRPKLMYLKNATQPRETRLEDLLARIGEDPGALTKRFDTAEELENLVKEDLAQLLTTGFKTAAPDHERLENDATARLPADITPLVGRNDEIEAIARLIEDGTRLVTLTGPGGTGKTRLAIATARALAPSFPDGIHFVPLSPVSQPALVATTIAQAVGLRPTGPEEPVDALIDLFRNRRALIVIDNFEHLMDAAGVVSQLLLGCERLHVLVTSRELLRLNGEQEFPVLPLEVPDEDGDLRARPAEAAELFVERARAARSDFELDTSTAPAIAEIVRLLDGLPLAIELAAARVRVLPPRSLLDKLRSGFEVLSGGARDMPERHRALHRTIRWSYDLLRPEEQDLFAKLGAFEGSFTLEAVEAMFDEGAGDLLETFASLLDKSMVRGAAESGVGPRFSMLRTIRDFARELLDKRPDEAAVREAYARHYLALAEEAGPALRSSEQRSWIRRLDVEIANVRAAIDRALAGRAADTVAAVGWALWPFWWAGGYLAEGRTWMERALAGDLDPVARGRALGVLGVMAFWQGDLAAALPAVTEAMPIFEANGDRSGRSMIALSVGLTEALMGDPDGGRARLRDARAFFREHGDAWGAVMALNGLCWLEELLRDTEGDPDEYRILLDEANAVGSDLEIANALANNAYLMHRHGKPEAAAVYLERALAVHQPLRNKGSTWYFLEQLADVTLTLGDHVRSAKLLGAGESIRERIGMLPFGGVRNPDAIRTEIAAAIGEAATEEAISEGKGMGFDEAVGYARTGASTVTSG